MDKEVAGIFLKNIDDIVKAYSKRDIPVIMVEPVCNLYDMPPFAGEGDDKYKKFILEYNDVVKSNDKEKVKEFYTGRLNKKEYDINANIRYLDAQSRRIIDGKPDMDSFISAKDLDIVPFRVRSELVKELEHYCES